MNSQVLITEQLELPGLTIPSAALAAGPDGRIYIGHSPGGGSGPLWPAAIEHPDSSGTACTLDPNSIYLASSSIAGTSLPNFCKRYHDNGLTVASGTHIEPEWAFNMWPVQVNDQLHVRAPSAGLIKVSDMLGREVIMLNTDHAGMRTVECRALRQGQYTITFTGDSHGPDARAFLNY